MQEEYVFESHDALISYLYTRFPERTPLSPLKLQKILYFLFAFYGSMLGNITKEDVESSEVEATFPRYLFDAKFEAWKYGPVIRDVYDKNREGQYNEVESIDVSDIDRSALDFIDDVFIQLEDMGDFTLVQRSHMDKAWKSVYDPENPYASKPMDNALIISEYEE